jgi:osomolarity two-component system response regulator SSK1
LLIVRPVFLPLFECLFITELDTPTQSSVKTDVTHGSSSDSLTPTATLPGTLPNDGEEIRENGHAGALRPRPPDRDTSVHKVPLP